MVSGDNAVSTGSLWNAGRDNLSSYVVAGYDE